MARSSRWDFLCFREIVLVAHWIFVICTKLCILAHFYPLLCLCISFKMPRASQLSLILSKQFCFLVYSILLLQIVIDIQELNLRLWNHQESRKPRF